MTQPVDVVKTRMMNAKPGDYKVIIIVIIIIIISNNTEYTKLCYVYW